MSRDQAVLGVVYIDAGSNVHGGDQYHALADSAFRQRGLNLRGYVDVFSMFPGSKRQVFRMESHTRDNSRVPDAAVLLKEGLLTTASVNVRLFRCVL